MSEEIKNPAVLAGEAEESQNFIHQFIQEDLGDTNIPLLLRIKVPWTFV